MSAPTTRPQRTTFGANLRRARRTARLSQADLATRLGLKRPTPISLWERSATLPEPDTIARVAKALNVSTAALLRGVVTPYDALRQGEPLTVRRERAYADEAEWVRIGLIAGSALRQSIGEMIAEMARARDANERRVTGDARRRRERAAPLDGGAAGIGPTPPTAAPAAGTGRRLPPR